MWRAISSVCGAYHTLDLQSAQSTLEVRCVPHTGPPVCATCTGGPLRATHWRSTHWTSSLRNVILTCTLEVRVACHTLEIRTLDLQSAQYKLTLEDARTLERRTLEGARYLLLCVRCRCHAGKGVSELELACNQRVIAAGAQHPHWTLLPLTCALAIIWVQSHAPSLPRALLLRGADIIARLADDGVRRLRLPHLFFQCLAPLRVRWRFSCEQAVDP